MTCKRGTSEHGGLFGRSRGCEAIERAVQGATGPHLPSVHGRICAVCRCARGAGAHGHAALVDRYCVFAGHHRPLCGHRDQEPHHRRQRVLRRGAAGTGHLQRHGGWRGLDVRGFISGFGRYAVPHRLQRPGLHHGLDRRLLPGCAGAGALPAQVRPVHHS